MNLSLTVHKHMKQTYSGMFLNKDLDMGGFQINTKKKKNDQKEKTKTKKL